MTPVMVVEWALVKVGGQTVCRHIFVIAMLRVFEQKQARRLCPWIRHILISI